MRRLLPILGLLLLIAGCAPAAQSPFFFVQIADTQLGFSANNADLKIEMDNFRRAVDDINRLKPAFVLISGDLVNDPHNPKQIRAFWSVARGISPGIPVHLVAGNHDVGSATEANVKSYRKLFGDDWYAFRYGGSEFVVLDSCLIHDADADPTIRDSQRKWLEQVLAESRSRKPSHVFVCTHHPWFISNAGEADQYFNIPNSQRQDYLKLFGRFGVDYALAGHLHKNALATGGGLNMITTSAVSKPLGPDPVGLRVFRVYPDRVEHDYYPLDKVPDKIRM